jgi:hypothetical protein
MSDTVTCSLGNLASGANAVVTIIVTPTGGCSITNTASVTANEADPDLSNNSATESTRVLLDNFNRPNGGLGVSWAGAKSGYKIVSQQADVEAGGQIYWYPSSYGANQEACITLPRVDPKGQHQSVMLKMQGTSWRSGSIFVFYNAVTKKIGIETYVPNKGWTTLATFDATLQDGDQLGGRAEADGTVRAFVNGVEIGTANAGSFFVGKGGRIGLWFIVAADAVLDDFAGGTIAP